MHCIDNNWIIGEICWNIYRNENLNDRYKAYSENQKTLEQEDDFQTQDMILYSLMNISYGTCAV